MTGSGGLDAQLALLPERLGFQLWLVLASLAVGAALSLPLALLAVGRPALRWLVLSGAGVVQTIPGLALLALMVPLLDALRRALGASFSAFGFLPAALALVLYSMLPVLRNAVTGLGGVDANVLEAAVGLGLSPRDVLLRVRLPLAAPVILAGLRTSAVWTVGMATLSTPIGQTSLGNYIFAGLQTRDWAAVLVGCLATAALALVLDAALGLLERSAQERRRLPLVLGLSMLAGLVLLAVGLRPGHAAGARGRVLKVGAKNFTEQYLLAEALTLSLRAAGYEATPVEGLGSTVLFDALAGGDVDVAVEYSGTMWANQLKRAELPGREAMNAELTRWLEATSGVSCLGSLGFENTYAFALPSERARALGISSLEQLAGPLRSMRLGSDYEFFSRPEWRRVSAAYGLAPREQVSFDPSLMYAAVKSGDVEVITAFSTDGRLSAFGLTVLTDPRQAFPPYDALLLVSQAAGRDPKLVEVLRRWVGAIDAETMRHANQLVDVDGRSRSEAAAWLLGALGDGGVR